MYDFLFNPSCWEIDMGVLCFYPFLDSRLVCSPLFFFPRLYDPVFDSRITKGWPCNDDGGNPLGQAGFGLVSIQKRGFCGIPVDVLQPGLLVKVNERDDTSSWLVRVRLWIDGPMIPMTVPDNWRYIHRWKLTSQKSQIQNPCAVLVWLLLASACP